MRLHSRSLTMTLGLLLAIACWLGRPPAAEAGCLDTIGTFDQGDVFSADVASGRAYLGSGEMLLVLDLSNPAQPRLLGDVELKLEPAGILVIDDLAYIIGNGIHVVDLSDPTAPVILNTVSVTGAGRRITSFPGFLLTSEGNNVRVYDLTDPEVPSLVTSLFLGSATTGQIEVVGSLAYVPAAEALYLVDLTTPDALSIVSAIDISGASAVKTTGPHAIVVGNPDVDLVVVDVSDPAAPVTVGSLLLEHRITDVELIGDFAVAGSSDPGNGRLLTIDISDPTAPAVGDIFNGLSPIIDLVLDDNTLFAAQPRAGLGIVDATDPLDLQELGGYTTRSAIGRAQPQGDHLFLAAGKGGIRVLDISDPSQPAEIAAYNTAGEAHDLRLQGDTALVANGSGGFLSLDISNPLQIQELDRRTDQDLTKSLVVEAGLAYLADEFFGLRIVDVTSPAALVEVGQLQIGDRAEQLVVDGSLLYLADAHDGLRIFDVSDPTLPQQVGTLDMPGWSSRIGKSGDFVYINTQSTADSRVIDVSNPTQPDLTAINDCSASAILLDGDIGYLSCSLDIRLIRISPTGSVSTLTTRNLHSSFNSISKDGDRLYLGSSSTGLEILDLNGCDSLLADGFESGDLSAWSASAP